MKRLILVVNMLIVATMLLSACATPTPETIKEIVTQIVKETIIVAGTPQVVEKEVTKVVEKEVTKVVEKEVIKIVEKRVEVTVEPGEELSDNQVIRMANFRFLNDMSPFLGGATFIKGQIFKGPFMWNMQGETTPALCTHWDMNDDQTEYTLHVNPKAVWSDGTPVTAQQMKASWEYGAGPNNIDQARYRDILGVVKGFEDNFAGTTDGMEGLVVLDDLTLKIVLTQPNRLMEWNLGHHLLYVAPMEYVLANPEEWWADDPIVTGPYRINFWDNTLGRYEFTVNPNWWGDPPIIQMVEVVTVGDDQIMQLMWENNEVAFMGMSFGTSIGQDIVANEPESIFGPPPESRLRNYSIFFNFFVDNEPTQDIHVRRALMHAVDWDKLVEVAWDGEQIRRIGPLPHNQVQCSMYDVPGYKYEYDPELAKAELAKSSYGSAENLPRINIRTNSGSAEIQKACEIMVEYWRDNLGITNFEIGRELGGDEWRTNDEVQVFRISGGGPPDSARYLFQAISQEGYVCKDYHKGCMGDTEFGPRILELLKKADAMDRDDPEYCKTVQEAMGVWRDSYFAADLISGGERLQFVKWWLKGYEVNFSSLWTTLPEMYIVKH